MPECNEDAGEAEEDEMPAGWRAPAFHRRDIAAEAAITMTFVVKVTTITGICAGTERPIRSRAAPNAADAKASRTADEIPAGPGCATRKAPANPTSASATRAVPTRSPRRRATARMTISGVV